MNYPICVGITGASGAIYGVRLLEVLRALGRDVHLSISPSGRDVIAHELNIKVDLDHFDISSLLSNSGHDPNESRIPLLQETAAGSRSGSTPTGTKTAR